MGICTVVQKTDCSAITEAMILMAADVHDREQETALDLTARDLECHHAITDTAHEVEHLALRLGRIQGDVASITALRAGEQEEIRLKSAEFLHATRDLHKAQQQCTNELADLEGEMCGLRQMRTEVYEADGAVAPTGDDIRDCEVTPWVHALCSVTCGGGVQKLTREVVLSAGPYGMACPELAITRTCSAQPCPVDCKVSPWSEWSPCSVLCGGGTRSRLRSIEARATNGGEPCPTENGNNEQCHSHSCDSECIMGVWSSWSDCSRGCGGGFRHRSRGIATAATGNGFCAPEEDRQDYSRCNTQLCINSTQSGLLNTVQTELKCDSELDLAIVLESGGGGDAKQGFEDAKAFLKSFFTSMLPLTSSQVRVALISAGGPTSWNSFLQCEAGTSMDACNVKLELSFTSVVSAATSAVDSMQWPGAPSHVAGGLSLAATALVEQGRPNAHSAIIVLARGQPLSIFGTGYEAKHIRDQTRLLWVLTSPDIPVHEVEGWASRPVHDNILHTTLAATRRGAEVSDVLSAVCPVVKTVQSR